MQLLAELIGEWLLGLPDFEPEKQAPFGSRYWLGWLGILFPMLLIGMLGYIGFFSLMKTLESFHLGYMVLTMLLLCLRSFCFGDLANTWSGCVAQPTIIGRGNRKHQLELVFF
ncbi:hypothetical protein ACEE16_04640 [Streptococcus suis]|uniref:hypothetical protein n=1 Tax=Streptococcus suis TaxID=1307 RepID=UPI000CF479E5